MRHLLMRHKWLARHRTSRISPNRPNIEERFWFSFLMGNLSKSAAAGNCSRQGKTLALPAFSLIAWKCQQQQRLLFSFIWSFATRLPLVCDLSLCLLITRLSSAVFLLLSQRSFHFSHPKNVRCRWSLDQPAPTVLSLLARNVSFFKKWRKLAEASAFFLIVNSIPFQPRLLLPPSAALKSRREIKRESLILPSNTRTLKLPLPWTH